MSAKNLPARLQEKSLVDFFAGHSEEISRRIGKKIDLAQQKPYTEPTTPVIPNARNFSAPLHSTATNRWVIRS